MEEPKLSWRVVALLSFALSWPMAAAVAQEAEKIDFDTALGRYRQYLTEPALHYRTEARRLMAASSDPRVFPILVKDYDDPGEQAQFVRALMLRQLSIWYRGEQPYEVWQQWRQKHKKPEDAWLWYEALRVECAQDAGRWREAFAGRQPVQLQAAALRAAAARDGGALLDDETTGLIFETAAALSRKPDERSLQLEALVGMFEGRKEPLEGPRRALLRTLVHALGERQTPERCRVVLARALSRILDRKNIGPVAEQWIALLEDQVSEQVEIAYAQQLAQVRPGFFGITEHGRSFAYLVDASDSMLDPLTPRERSDMQPLTGGGSTAKGDPAEPARADEAERSVDWSKVVSRFDAARELLKLALRRHAPDDRVTVVLFGDSASYLDATPGLVKAAPKTIEAACKELDQIVAGRVRQDRPHGTLRGDTNVHGAFVLAFLAGEKQPRGGTSGAGRKGKEKPIRDLVLFDDKGVDTIYLLSDGKPSRDDFDGPGHNEGGYVVDTETGARRAHAGPVMVRGPFLYEPYLLADLERMNLLQRAAIHAIGFGEADYELLKKLAAIGHGETVRIGAK